MASIHRRGNDRWQVRWRGLRGEQRARTVPSRTAATQLKREIEQALGLGREWEPVGLRALVHLRDVAGAFLEHRAVRLRRQTMTSYAYNADLFGRFLVETQGRPPFTAALLSRRLLDELYAWLGRPETGRHGKQRSVASRNICVRVVQQAWRWAYESERWEGDIPTPRTIDLARARRQAVVAPTWAEMDACVLALTGEWLKLGLLLRYTGLRPGSLLGLGWADVDLDRATAILRAAHEKTDAARIVPLSPHLVAAMAGWGVREGYVLGGARPLRRASASEALKAAWQRAGIREEVWRGKPVRAFRAGWKSGLLRLGADRDAVDWLQGHVLDRGSARGAYIDAWSALPLVETVALVPAVGESEANVVKLEKAR